MSTRPVEESTTNPIAAAFRNPGFVACVAMLVVFSVSLQWLIAHKELTIKKLPVPLRKPLAMLDDARLAPIYRKLHAADIKPEILDALGTREYIQWTLEDASAGNPGAPENIIHLFVTYYTDKPGQIPHIPEECHLASGYNAIRSEVINIPVPELGESVPVKILVFEKSTFLHRESRVVMYTFHSNGAFAADRNAVKVRVGDPRSKYAYFSKLEVSFGTPDALPPQDKAIEAGKRFLQKVVPVLVKEHWPDWAEVEKMDKLAHAGPADGSSTAEAAKP